MKENAVDIKKATFLIVYERQMGYASKAIEAAHTSFKSYSMWRANDSAFDEGCKAIEEGLIDLAESVIFTHLQADSLKAAMYYLDRKAKHRGYVRRSELTGPDGQPMGVVGRTMTDKEAANTYIDNMRQLNGRPPELPAPDDTIKDCNKGAN